MKARKKNWIFKLTNNVSESIQFFRLILRLHETSDWGYGARAFY